MKRFPSAAGYFHPVLPATILIATVALPAQAVLAAEGDHLTFGLGAGIVPRYEGSDEHRVTAVPLIDAQYGLFFARSGDGLGLKLLQTPQFTAGVGLNWMQGYDRDDVPDGIGKLSDALGARIFVSTHFSGAVATLSATQAVTKSERGLIANARLSYPYDVTDRFKVVPSVAVNWANAKYMNSYFGIDSEQAARSGLSKYHPSAGFKDASLRVGFNYELSKNWNITGAVGVSRLLGNAADSPLVKRKTQVVGAIGVTYDF
ncbi:structural protein MipA [Advenella kashmirensis W13003]|uniref:Structural protein MipA n=1 Tax=Advenella kashmirensis W13003 TaxID=1424334 RepID=V8QXJ8_9BURK|nr:MipA/OmpV family protein [Advenella kashmirensis]ETF04020.1 structural protein MipA [Advenella kashmirensis W13003]